MQAKNTRWLSLAVGTLMMIILGLVYAWSVFVVPLELEFGWDRAQTSLTFTICMIFFVLGLIASGFLSNVLSKRKITILAAVFLLLGFGFCSRINTLTGLYCFYGIFVGFGVGIANNALVSTIVKWFPDKTGLASGILMMGFGLGGLVLSPLAKSLMSTVGWRTTFLGFGIVFSLIMALGSIVVVMPPEDYGKSFALAGKKSAPPAKDIPITGVVRSGSFWLYILWFSMITSGGLLVIGHAAPFAEGISSAPLFAATVTGLLSLCNGLGRVITGAVYDKFGLRTSMHMTTFSMILAALLLIFASMTGNSILLIAGFVFTGLSYGGCPPTSSTFAMSFYGPKHFAINYAAVSAGMIPGASIGPMIAANLYKSSGGYMTSFLTMLIFGAPALFFLWLLFRKSANAK